MKNSPDMHYLKTLLLIVCLLAFSQWAIAADKPGNTADRDQPITIEADRAEINEREQISIYTGNVELTQGGLKLWADIVTVYTVENELDRLQAEGNPVRYRQERVDEEPIRGHSLRLDYDANSEQVLLTKNAEFWQGENHFSGERILYDMKLENVLANGSDGKTDKKDKRVHVIIQPKSQDPNKP